MLRRLLGMLALVCALPLAAQLRPAGYHPGNLAYWNTPYFANALTLGGEWRSFSGTEFGDPIDFDTPQFLHGYPQYLNAGQKLRAPLFGLNVDAARGALATGRIVLTWNGNADLRLAGGTLIESTAGRRVYQFTNPLQSLEVHAIGSPAPTRIRVWLEHEGASLEGQLFHPLLLERLADRDWAFIRFMDWMATNASPVAAWSDRRMPAHIFMSGDAGVAYEHMVALCNASGRDLWLNVPHLASDEFITKLAKLIRFGSDGVEPYDAPRANPVYAPLDANRKVYVEYSNEIWSGGPSFPQGDWAEAQAASLGISRPRFNARRFCETWDAFEDVFDGTERLVRVAATFTANDTYTNAFLNEIATCGTADVLAVTTYFGNGIQDYVAQQGFVQGNAAHRTAAFDEWKRRIMAGDAVEGAGPDATGIGGGFSAALRAHGLPIIAYEGGPSLYTDDAVTPFINDMNRDPRIAELYRMHLEVARSKGLWTHTPYTDTSPWSRFGQWGHLETLDQPLADAPKYALLLEHFDTYSTLRHIDAPMGAVPQFTTAATLPPAVVGAPYVVDLEASGGDGVRTMTVIGAYLESSLTIAAGPSHGTLRISGTPSMARKNYILARVHDTHGDPAWRAFTLEAFGGPGTLVQSDFRGASPALHQPWTKTYVLSPKVTWSGWTNGGSATPLSGDDAFVFSTSGSSAAHVTATVTPTEPLDLRGAEIRFSTRRIGYHSPLRYSLTLNGAELYAGSSVTKDNLDEITHSVAIPSTASFASVSSPLELRIHTHGAQFDGHATSLTSFKLTQAATITLTATATSATQVSLTWTSLPGTLYQIFRDGSLIATTTSTAFTDTVSPNTAHVYRVSTSNPDLATTVLFTEDPLIAQSTLLRAVHLAELRTAVNAVRTAAALPPIGFAHAPVVRASHILDLRTALTPALAALGLSAPPFAPLPSIVHAGEMQQLRNAVK
ncbi:MAG TPA: hypothetical protein VEK11_03750 [Thermoanaerobaculia bacterium]|nr:hypothetical protein [Thermoanaerobaculia bacterium]